MFECAPQLASRLRKCAMTFSRRGLSRGSVETEAGFKLERVVPTRSSYFLVEAIAV